VSLTIAGRKKLSYLSWTVQICPRAWQIAAANCVSSAATASVHTAATFFNSSSSNLSSSNASHRLHHKDPPRNMVIISSSRFVIRRSGSVDRLSEKNTVAPETKAMEEGVYRN
jgi:hypothetical protein